MIEISVNNTQHQFEKPVTIEYLLNALGYQGDNMLGVAHNTIFVSKDDWGNTLLQHQDELDILNPISGG